MQSRCDSCVGYWEKVLQGDQNDVVDIEDTDENCDSHNHGSQSNSLDTVDRLAEHFKVPLEIASANFNEIREEFYVSDGACHSVYFTSEHGLQISMVAIV